MKRTKETEKLKKKSECNKKKKSNNNDVQKIVHSLESSRLGDLQSSPNQRTLEMYEKVYSNRDTRIYCKWNCDKKASERN